MIPTISVHRELSCSRFRVSAIRGTGNGWGYTHDRRADKNPYPHDRRADKDSYPHDRNVTDDLCSLIKLCSAFIMVNFST